ncbi:MAG: polysaccharide deacetylase family protein [Candidatus Gracilibacteria bacterium]|nr:polysaccharide deacetylase family protein [Candidatus Gracilibacteria bacterium]
MRKILLTLCLSILLYSCGVVTPEPEVSENLQLETQILEEKINKLNRLREQARLLKQENKCENINDINLNILVYNNFELDGVIDENIINTENILNLESFEENIKLLKKYNDEQKIYIAGLNELEFFEEEGCFPNKNLVLLISNNSKVSFYTEIFPIIEKYNIKYNLALNTANLRKTGRYENFMTTPELLEIINTNNFDFLSNGVTGIRLTNIENKEKLKHEICSSKNYLDTNFIHNTSAIFYPEGKYNDEIIDLTRECEYKYGIYINNNQNNKTEQKNGLIGNNKYKLRGYNMDKNFDFNKILNN